MKRVAVQREKVEQEHGVQLLRALGAKVYVSGTRRRAGDYQGTMQTPGIPDVEAWLPGARHGFPRLRVLLKWEVKSAAGKMSPAQLEYRELCIQASVAHVCGDFDALIAWLIQQKWLREDQVAHYRARNAHV